MKSTFPIQLQLANEMRGDPVSLERIQNEVVRQSLEQIRYHSTQHSESIRALELRVGELAACLQRRTAQWSPAKAVSLQQHARPPLQAVARQLVFNNATVSATSSASAPEYPSLLGEPFYEHVGDDREAEADDAGTYLAKDHSLRGFIAPSPNNSSPRPRMKLDLVLPPLIAFRAPGKVFSDFWS